MLPVDLREKWSVSRMAGVFDAIPEVMDEERMDRTLGDGDADDTSSTKSRERIPRNKRVLMAVVAEDSTVVYYLVHEGVVKPRQN